MNTTRLSRLVFAVVFLLAVAPAWADDAKDPEAKGKKRDVFIVGNSLIEGVKTTKGLRSLTEGRGHNLSGQKKSGEYRQIVAGAPLWWHWHEGPKESDLTYRDQFEPLLKTQRWDVLCLQPHGGPLYGMGVKYTPRPREQGDVGMASNFIDLLIKDGVSPDVQVYLYSHWPKMPGYEKRKWGDKKLIPQAERDKALAAFDFNSLWDAPYTEAGPCVNGPELRSVEQTGLRRCRAYFEQLMDILNENYKGKLKKPVLLIPVGDVLYELNERLGKNPQKGDGDVVYSNIRQFYGDSTHLAPGVGRYIMAMTFYAALYRESPVGLPIGAYNDLKTYFSLFHPDFQKITPNMQKLIQETVWDVVSKHPRAGIATATKTEDEQL